MRLAQDDEIVLSFRKSHPDILMMKSGQDRNGGNDTRPLDRSTQGRIFLERQVGACLAVIGGIRSEDLPQMPSTDNQHVIQILAPQRADQALYMAILLGRTWRDRSVANANGPQPVLVDVSVSAVVIAHQVGWRRYPGEGLSDLSG